jgi:REP element-mobilizing transposase RayT
MARKLRLEYEGAVYHVINRGNYRADVFAEEGAKLAFMTCLGEVCERTGWQVHAWCVMSNHYHLAIETPEPNLVAGMQWLQGTFATRFNRYRRECGHLFQGRYKSLLVDPGEALGALCHYIHLNPVRAGIASVENLPRWPWSSMHWLMTPKARTGWYRPAAALGDAGGLTDTPTGRSKYLSYLQWLSANEPEQRRRCFERMSKGWVLGTTEFRADLAEEHRHAAAALEDGETEAGATREELLARRLKRLMRAVGKTKTNVQRDRKGAPWKIAVAAEMKRTTTATNRWLGEALNMGNPFRVSRLVSACQQEPGSAREFLRKIAKSKA